MFGPGERKDNKISEVPETTKVMKPRFRWRVAVPLWVPSGRVGRGAELRSCSLRSSSFSGLSYTGGVDDRDGPGEPADGSRCTPPNGSACGTHPGRPRRRRGERRLARPHHPAPGQGEI